MVLRMTDEMNRWFKEGTEIYDQCLYYFRQEFFRARDTKTKPDYDTRAIYNLVKDTSAWKNSSLDYNVRQQVFKKVKENWFSFLKARKAYWKDKSKFLGEPKLPKYMKSFKTSMLLFDKSRLRNKDMVNNTISLPKSRFVIQLPDYIKIPSIRCVIAKLYYGKVKVTISYEKEVEPKKTDKKKYLGIDIGVENIAAMTTDGQTRKSWIVKGGCVKSINQFYNKRVAELRSILETMNKKHSSKRIQKMNMRRAHKLDYEFHCISKAIIGICLDNGIGTIVIGHNQGWKQRSNMSKKSNQKFVQIPFNDLIWKIRYKAEEAGISVIETEESYTSKIDHCVQEEMCHHEKYLGRRMKRGFFKSSTGKILNADINGAIGMLRKVNALRDADLVGLLDRGDVVSPKVLKYKP